MERYVAWLDSDEAPLLSQRYIGSAVADFHRNLIHGGIFGYPADADQPHGKPRLLYEAAPLAFLAHQAGGYATDGHAAVLLVGCTSGHRSSSETTISHVKPRSSSDSGQAPGSTDLPVPLTSCHDEA